MNLDPGNQDLQLSESDQSNPTYSDLDSNDILADKDNNQENQPREELMEQLKKKWNEFARKASNCLRITKLCC